MDTLIIWKSLVLFIFTMLFFWVIFYTFQPGFLGEDDKMSPKTGESGYNDSDAILNDKGRTKIFLFSLIPGGIAVFLYVVYSFYFIRPVTIKCSPKAKKMGQCKIIRR